jgi:uncharacterized protein DUF1360
MTETTDIPRAAQARTEGYGGPDTPFGAYTALMATFVSAAATTAVVARRTRKVPDRIAWSDLALASVGVHRLTRLLAKDRVTSALRAPFVEYQGKGLPSEFEEKPRGSGLRLAVGQLINCPYCLGEWVALAAVAGLVLAPRPTRAVASVLTVATASDVLQELYARLAPES